MRAINANATKTLHEVNSAIAIASFMNSTSVALVIGTFILLAI